MLLFIIKIIYEYRKKEYKLKDTEVSVNNLHLHSVDILNN